MHDNMGYILHEVIRMSETINVTVRLDRDIKERAETMFNDFGMNLSTAVNIFVRQSLRQGKIPFEIADPYYNGKTMERLQKSIAEFAAGKVIEKTMDELEAMENA
jgi:DNA-damage-inducible protein J